jgi:hypothetical protein
MGQTLSENLVKKSNQTAALPSTAVLALPAPDAEQTSCNQLTLHLPSTESSLLIVKFWIIVNLQSLKTAGFDCIHVRVSDLTLF